MNGRERIYEVLSAYISGDAITRGITVIEELHGRFNDLLNRRYETIDFSYAGEDGYTSWYCYRLTPALEEIGRDGWVERHLWDMSRLAASDALGDCCRRTPAEA